MSDDDKPQVGMIGWTDLSVPDAEGLRDFYSQVVGWKPEPVDMGDYNDFNMTIPGTGDAMAGICHARGMNADMPAQWIIYIVVEDVEASAKRCVELGGKVLAGPRGEKATFCVIQDPAGAVAALFEPHE